MPARRETRVTRSAIDPSDVLRSVADPGSGAVVLFLGTVRDNSEAGSVARIEYEVYEPMAERRLAEVEQEVKRKWPTTTGVKILHRVGGLAVGEVSVAVAVSSPHRAEAFEACRHAIETIKRDAPIWKREKLGDGSEVWVEGVPLGSSGRAGSKRRVKKRASR
ncbi:MAG TPA: molybdenum cofactor biosynthesis protein MoaE [Nitrososphaerales archaeon]|nr:molybdenum cofactor biosynthesis protein MoaE [Nitrososphaerales archaeon]